MIGQDVRGLLTALEACGVRLSVGQGGTLALTGKRPPADLLNALQAGKGDVLAYLTAKEDEGQGGASLPSPEVLPGVSVTNTTEGRVLPDWAQISAQPGRCGSCTRAEDAPDWGPLMVTCTCDPVAWWPLPAPFALHVGARCGAYLHAGEEVGRGWRSRHTGKRWGPAVPVAWDDLPTLEGGAA
ncbi:hypothetical protein DEDE109153_01050 [Deinococcus deserti]|uniref:Uncharacterized protein n=1 Tax=Deinococcus deserti (strain DSM 17065 / CIP 109153 / LMG 22923 / VCD115) TaxID=546414 RepID=C1CVM6_DEIDV|nr:hypothetical protein [Deinococcus deserti]ACO46243.1 Hypothetical protein Deide_13081 [Deinococcus deserti VCD115]